MESSNAGIAGQLIVGRPHRRASGARPCAQAQRCEPRYAALGRHTLYTYAWQGTRNHAGAAAKTAAKDPARRAERAVWGRSSRGSHSRRSSAAAMEVAARPQRAHAARPGLSGRSARCMRQARRPCPGPRPGGWESRRQSRKRRAVRVLRILVRPPPDCEPWGTGNALAARPARPATSHSTPVLPAHPASGNMHRPGRTRPRPRMASPRRVAPPIPATFAQRLAPTRFARSP